MDFGLNDVVAYLRNLPGVAVNYFNLVKLLFVVPATYAVREHSASALKLKGSRHIFECMLQERLNHCIIIYVHKEMTRQIEQGRYWKSVCLSINSHAESLLNRRCQLKLSQTMYSTLQQTDN